MEKQNNLNIINNYCDNKEKKDVIENNENEKNVFLDEEKRMFYLKKKMIFWKMKK